MNVGAESSCTDLGTQNGGSHDMTTVVACTSGSWPARQARVAGVAPRTMRLLFAGLASLAAMTGHAHASRSRLSRVAMR